MAVSDALGDCQPRQRLIPGDASVGSRHCQRSLCQPQHHGRCHFHGALSFPIGPRTFLALHLYSARDGKRRLC